MRIEFVRSWLGIEAGKPLDCDDIMAEVLIRRKIAKAIDEPPRDKMMKKEMVKTK